MPAVKKGAGGRKMPEKKVVAEVRELARKYADKAVEELGRLALEATSEASRLAAIKEVLDRAYGKARQTTDPVCGVERAVRTIERRLVRPEDPHR
jgi:hypothetical protein